MADAPNEFLRGIRSTIISVDLINAACGNMPWMLSTNKAGTDTANNGIHPIAIIESQLVPAQYASDERGIDGGKK